MRLIRPARLLGLLVALALLICPAAALADGDPASDYLITQYTFFPYPPNVISPNVVAAVNRTAANAKAAGFPIRVAIIASATDLGAVPDLFGKPQKYADFLRQEITFNNQPILLVVMPQGFGVAGAGPPSVLAGRTIPAAGGADRLGRAAIPAIGALAANAGHPIALASISSSSGSGGGGSSALLTFGAPLALVLLVAGGAALAASRRADAGGPEFGEDEDEDEDDGEDEGGDEGEDEGAEGGAREPAEPAAAALTPESAAPRASEGEPTPAPERAEPAVAPEAPAERVAPESPESRAAEPAQPAPETAERVAPESPESRAAEPAQPAPEPAETAAATPRTPAPEDRG